MSIAVSGAVYLAATAFLVAIRWRDTKAAAENRAMERRIRMKKNQERRMRTEAIEYRPVQTS